MLALVDVGAHRDERARLRLQRQAAQARVRGRDAEGLVQPRDSPGKALVPQIGEKHGHVPVIRPC